MPGFEVATVTLDVSFYRHKQKPVYASTFFAKGQYFTDVGYCNDKTYIGKTHQTKQPFDFSNFVPISHEEYKRFRIHDCIYG